MDTAISAREAARRLGTTAPRIVRAVDRLGLDVERGPGGRLRLLPRHIARLETELGVSPAAADLSPAEGRVLAALARAPLGLPSARAVASRAAVSPTAAGRALERLSARDLVKRERRPVAMGGVRQVDLFRVNVRAPEWHRLAPALGVAKRPRRRPPSKDARVPPRLRHLFWNTAPEQLDVDAHGGYIARRLLSSGDVEGLAWGADNLSRADWAHASRMRGLAPDLRALGRNLAAAPHDFSSAGTLNGVFSKTKVQFLHADEAEPQRRLEPGEQIGGVDVAGVGDILAMKLKVVAERGELRDYFDLMAIEQQAGRTVEEGIALFVERYARPPEPATAEPIVRALGYFDDVDDDLALPVGKDEIAAYWQRRQPQLIRHIARFGTP